MTRLPSINEVVPTLSNRVCHREDGIVVGKGETSHAQIIGHPVGKRETLFSPQNTLVTPYFVVGYGAICQSLCYLMSLPPPKLLPNMINTALVETFFCTKA